MLSWLTVSFCSLAQGFESLSDFAEHLAASVDIVFPVIHGKFGEDGGIQVYYCITFTSTASLQHKHTLMDLFSISCFGM